MKLAIAISIAALALGATAPSMAQDKPQLAFVVNAASDFWKLAEAGVKKAQQ
jgi:ribose transport system substrate-binding protein